MKHRLAAALVGACLALSTGAAAAEFTFVALGDMPYGPREQAYPAFRALIAEINDRAPVFTIHVGDTKSGADPCSDRLLLEQRDFMDSFASALVYTPGDNEWTDCHRLLAGAYDPLDRLRFIRTHYFRTAESLGRQPIRLERQADVMPGFEPFVENSRFSWGGVWFVTAHVVGSNNNLDAVEGSEAAEEFFARDKANRVCWRTRSTRPRPRTPRPWWSPFTPTCSGTGSIQSRETFARASGFKGFAETLITKAQSFRKPGPAAFRGQSRVPGFSTLCPLGRQPDRSGGVRGGAHARRRGCGRSGHGSRVHVQVRPESRLA